MLIIKRFIKTLISEGLTTPNPAPPHKGEGTAKVSRN